MKKSSILCAGLSAAVWLVVCAALLDAGLARHFDPEQECSADRPSAICGNVR